MLGVCHVLLLDDSLLADLTWWVRHDVLEVFSRVCISCYFLSVGNLMPPDDVSDDPTGSGSCV